MTAEATLARRPSPWLLIGSTLALVGWAHLTSPRGPDFRQTLVRWHAGTAQTSVRDTDERKRRETRLRRELSVNGYRLIRTRRRTLSPGEGGYLVVEFATGQVVAGSEPTLFSFDLDMVEAWWRQTDASRRAVAFE